VTHDRRMIVSDNGTLDEYFFQLAFWFEQPNLDIGNRRPDDVTERVYARDPVIGDNAAVSANHQTDKLAHRCRKIAESIKEARHGRSQVNNLRQLYEIVLKNVA